MSYDVTIIGGGHNGLVTAAYLARSGRSVLVLERRESLGGTASVHESPNGDEAPGCTHLVSPIHEVVKDLGLAELGLELIPLSPMTFAPLPDGRALILHQDVNSSCEEIARFSQKDADRYAALSSFLDRVLPPIRHLMTMTPPAARYTGVKDIWGLLGAGYQFKRLSKADQFEVLRLAAMCTADFVGEWFDTPILRAVIAARGLVGTMAGPWSPGTTAVLLRDAALSYPDGPTFPRGGMRRYVDALARAARREGAEIRTGTEVTRVRIEEGTARGVELADGEYIESRLVVSNADPVRTLTSFLRPGDLMPKHMERIRNYRCRGTTAKLNLTLSEPPRYTAASSPSQHARACTHIGPEIDYLEKAYDATKYGQYSEHPWLEVLQPTAFDPQIAGEGRHQLSIYMNFAPRHLKEGSWEDHREALADRIVKKLAAYAPNLPGAILERDIVTPEDMETRYALSGGHIQHGEPALDQLYAMRPISGFARYQTPVKNLYLCGTGTHPGGGLTGACGYNAARQIQSDWGHEIL